MIKEKKISHNLHDTYHVKLIANLKKYNISRQEQFNSLTDRELEIFHLLANGLNNPEISEKLNISRFTVENHRRHINKKLEITHFKDLIKYALAFKVVKL